MMKMLSCSSLLKLRSRYCTPYCLDCSGLHPLLHYVLFNLMSSSSKHVFPLAGHVGSPSISSFDPHYDPILLKLTSHLLEVPYATNVSYNEQTNWIVVVPWISHRTSRSLISAFVIAHHIWHTIEQNPPFSID